MIQRYYMSLKADCAGIFHTYTFIGVCMCHEHPNYIDINILQSVQSNIYDKHKYLNSEIPYVSSNTNERHTQRVLGFRFTSS